MIINLSSPRWPTRIVHVLLMNPRCLVLWTSVCDLACGKDVFAIMPRGFGKTIIFQLFQRLAKAALTLENSTIIVFSPLISLMRDQVEQLKKLGFLAASIGITEEEEDDEKKVRQGKCEIVFGSLESWSKSGKNKTVQRLLRLFKAFTKRDTTPSSQKTHTILRETLSWSLPSHNAILLG